VGPLVERARYGDHEAFDALARLVFDDLFAVAGRVLRDSDEAGDAVQDCLIEAWRDIPGLRDPDRFQAWIRKLLVRACYRAADRRRRRVQLSLMSIDRASTREESAVADRDEMERAFARLPIDQRVVLTLRYYIELTPGEVADVLSIPVGTVHSRLHNGLAALRGLVDADARAGDVVRERPA
jgi:RNA polymerase sigma-70 factor (ECF subfamily)